MVERRPAGGSGGPAAGRGRRPGGHRRRRRPRARPGRSIRPLHAFLARRNRILTAFRSLPADRLGVELARVTVEALRAATEASGLTGDQFRFGGGWGAAEGALARLLRPGADGASYLADHFGTLAPLLALDSALDELPRLLEIRTPAAEPAAAARGPSPRRAEPGAQPAAALPELPRASVVIVTWNGMEHLGPCLSSLAASDYPADRLEVVVVDNGSTDGTVEWIAREHPRVRVVPLASNQGFTGGNAAGVAAATGDVLVFFNNDMRVEPDTVRRLVTAAADGTACAAARVLSWDGRAIDFLRGTISFEARGFQDYYGEPVDARPHPRHRHVLPERRRLRGDAAPPTIAPAASTTRSSPTTTTSTSAGGCASPASTCASRTPRSSTTATARPAAPSRPDRSASSWSATRCGR